MLSLLLYEYDEISDWRMLLRLLPEYDEILDLFSLLRLFGNDEMLDLALLLSVLRP